MKLETYGGHSAKLTLDYECPCLQIVCDPGGIEPTGKEIGLSITVLRIWNTQRVVLAISTPHHPVAGICYESDDGVLFVVDEPNCPSELTLAIGEDQETHLKRRDTIEAPET
jgi:hypothetical protein